MAHREILFRAKKVKMGEWVEGSLITYRRWLAIRYDESSNDNAPVIVCENEECFIVNPETLGQYIGLKDKNKNKVFEGDVVTSIHWKPESYLVEFRSGAFCLTNPSLNIPIDVQYVNDFEIIGNIHDQPQLLEQ